MVRQTRPSGELWTVDDGWKKAVQKRMADLGISRSDLARLISVTPSAITILFRPETKQSRLVPKVHKALGMVVTTEAVAAIPRDEAFRKLEKIWQQLDDERRAHMLATGELLINKR